MPSPSSTAASSASGSSASGSNPATAPGASPAPAAVPRNLVGTVAVIDGTGLIVAPDRSSRIPKVGDQLFEGDAIVTKADGEVHVDMADGGYIAVRPNTIVKVSKYQANGDDGDHSVINLFKGSLRSITGWIGKTTPKNYAIVTPTATIGVRGTDHEPAYVPEGSQQPGQDAGTYDNVHAGGTTISNAAGKVDVTPDHAGFVDRRGNVAPRVLEHVPTFFSVPHAHDNLLVGKHEKVMASLDQRRAERVVQHRQELQRAPLGRPAAAERREMPRPAAAAPGSHPLLDRLKAMQQHAPEGRSGTTEARPSEARPAGGTSESAHPMLDRIKAAVARKPAPPPEPEKKKNEK